MKNYILGIIALSLGILTSCTNDDIDISKPIEVTIDPSSVINGFTEYNIGDINEFGTSDYLRVRSMFYDSKGVLQSEQIKYVKNYTTKVKYDLFLSSGTYDVITITDIVERSDDKTTFSYWLLKDSTSINDVKIVDNGHFGFTKNILGISHDKLSVSGESSNQLAVYPKAAGTLFVIEYNNIHYNTAITKIGFQTKMSNNDVRFSSGNTNYLCSFLTDDWYWLNNIVPSNYPNSSGIYSYGFQLKCAKAPFTFCTYESNQSTTHGMFSGDCSEGQEYLATIDMKDIDNPTIKEVTTSNSAKLFNMTLNKCTAVKNIWIPTQHQQMYLK